ncbi:hypothetical protein [Comamonas sp. B21-038]|uniref:hypothetical protein n=1 Tax=Comamonas sp. B21-038 TaxID=2918299 RepID=UPI001EFBAD2B|nr:hypothetical protein [Comamonas sp. B21-038]ULR87203.1 hypothetical protein MJ205_12000 [Comamonas sp. B21-038]
MKMQNTSATARRQPLLGKQVHSSTQTRFAQNVDASGHSTRTLQTSCLELNWVSGELLIRFSGSTIELAKVGA